MWLGTAAAEAIANNPYEEPEVRAPVVPQRPDAIGDGGYVAVYNGGGQYQKLEDATNAYASVTEGRQ